jgi:DNA repair protein RadC
MKIKDLTEDSRPREKLKRVGIENLSDAEILSLILKTGTKGENVIDISNRLIKKYSLEKLAECSLRELQEIKGIGFVKACQILALFEFNKRHNLAKNPVTKISCAEDVFDYFHDRLGDEKQENFMILLLNSKNIIIGEHLITKGILDASIVHPREVFRPAIKNSASKIVLVHNHPSGDPPPSEEDIEITTVLRKSGETLGITVLDHIIIGKDRFFSLKGN